MRDRETLQEIGADKVVMREGLQKAEGSATMSTGAYGAIPRDDFQRQSAHANLFYEEVRNRTGDIPKISHNTGFSEEDVAKIRGHVFVNKYDLGGEKPERFDSDYYMAVSWQRLVDGKNIQEMDIVLLHHELLEYRLMNEQGMKYATAHAIAEKEHNYVKYIKELIEKGGLL